MKHCFFLAGSQHIRKGSESVHFFLFDYFELAHGSPSHYSLECRDSGREVLEVSRSREVELELKTLSLVRTQGIRMRLRYFGV